MIEQTITDKQKELLEDTFLVHHLWSPPRQYKNKAGEWEPIDYTKHPELMKIMIQEFNRLIAENSYSWEVFSAFMTKTVDEAMY